MLIPCKSTIWYKIGLTIFFSSWSTLDCHQDRLATSIIIIIHSVKHDKLRPVSLGMQENHHHRAHILFFACAHTLLLFQLIFIYYWF